MLLLHIFVKVLVRPLKAEIVRKYLLIFAVELGELWQSASRLGQGVAALQKLIDIIKNQVVLENRDRVSLFVVN